MKARWLVLIVLAGTGCTPFTVRDAKDRVPGAPQALTRTKWPVTPDMVTEENGHRISQELLDELDREGR